MVESSLIFLVIVLAAAIVLAIVAVRRKAGAQRKPSGHLSRGSASGISSDRPERDVVPPAGSNWNFRGVHVAAQVVARAEQEH
jgi:hypothetical protein